MVLGQGVYAQEAIYAELVEYVGIRRELETPHPDSQWNPSSDGHEVPLGIFEPFLAG